MTDTTSPTDQSPTDQSPGDQSPGDQSDAARDADVLTRLEQEGEIAADYLEGLLDITDLDGDIDMDVEGDRCTHR